MLEGVNLNEEANRLITSLGYIYGLDDTQIKRMHDSYVIIRGNGSDGLGEEDVKTIQMGAALLKDRSEQTYFELATSSEFGDKERLASIFLGRLANMESLADRITQKVLSDIKGDSANFTSTEIGNHNIIRIGTNRKGEDVLKALTSEIGHHVLESMKARDSYNEVFFDPAVHEIFDAFARIVHVQGNIEFWEGYRVAPALLRMINSLTWKEIENYDRYGRRTAPIEFAGFQNVNKDKILDKFSILKNIKSIKERSKENKVLALAMLPKLLEEMLYTILGSHEQAKSFLEEDGSFVSHAIGVYFARKAVDLMKGDRLRTGLILGMMLKDPSSYWVSDYENFWHYFQSLATDSNVLEKVDNMVRERYALVPAVRTGTILDRSQAVSITNNAINPTGGIDFNSDKLNLQLQNNGGEIKFHIDPAMLQQLKNASGFVPVIINITPLKDVSVFLGIS